MLPKTPGFSTAPFTVLLLALELLMDQGFSCPCTPGLNAILISSIFLGPSLLALTVMVFSRRPCRHKSARFTERFLFCLIPPALWMFLLLFDGEYVACGVAHWEGDYVLDEKLKVKWCKPAEGNQTDLLHLTEKITFYSRLAALALLLLVSISVMTVVICSDCKNRPLEPLDDRDETPQQTSLSGSEAGEKRPSV